MAIREFGESLLADVRARKDQQASAERKRDKKAEISQLKGAALGFIAKEGFGLIKNSMEQGTADFLYKTEAGATKVKMNKAALEIENAFTLDAQAKAENLSLENIWGRKLAAEIVTKNQAEDVNFIMPGTM